MSVEAEDPRKDRWSADVVLADGSTTQVRPIHPGDAVALVAFHERQSRESIYYRYFSPRPHLSERDVEHLTTVDGADRMAFVAARDGDLIGIARYDRHPDRQVAEVAFFTDDAYHGKGIATLLLEYLAAYAREAGITGFEAHVLPSNRRMVRVFTQAGFKASSEFADGVIEVTLDIAPTDDAATAIAQRAHAAERQAVVRLLEPASVAVVGAGRDPSGLGHRVLRNLLAAPFAGPVYPIHPEARSIAGLRAYRSVLDVLDEIDMAVICIPASEVPAVMAECGQARVDVAVIISAGFSEASDAGQQLEDEVLATARRFGVRVLGPNCLGVINTDPAVALRATFVEIASPPGPVGLLSQSGTLGGVILDRAARQGVGISSFVAVGNKADLSGNDILQYWLDDDRTEVVLLYLESFGNPRRFGRNVRHVAARKPVFAVRSGAVLAAANSTESGWLDDDTIDALLRQTGVVRAPTLGALLDAALVASHQPIPAGNRIAVVGNSGGSASMAADACVDAGLVIAEPRAATIAAIDELALKGRRAANPVDLRFDATPQEYATVLAAVASDPDVDSVLVTHAPYDRDDFDGIADVLDDVATRFPAMTVVACVYGPHPPVTTGGVPIFDFPDDAAHAVGRVARYRAWLAGEQAGDILGLDDTGRLASAVAVHLADTPRRTLGPMSAGELLAAGAVEIVPVVDVADRSGLEALVADGLPFDGAVALKVQSHEPGAATRRRGVALDLPDVPAVLDAADAMSAELGAGAWPMLLQPMVESGTEVRVAIETHPVVGPVLRVGPGGGAARFADAARRVLPLTDIAAAELVEDAQVAGLLTDPGRDRLIHLLRKLAAVVDAAPEVTEVVCDPVIVRDDNTDVIQAQVTVEAATVDTRPPVRRLDATGQLPAVVVPSDAG